MFSTCEVSAKQIQQQILTEMMAIPRERAIAPIEACVTFIQLASSRQ